MAKSESVTDYQSKLKASAEGKPADREAAPEETGERAPASAVRKLTAAEAAVAMKGLEAAPVFLRLEEGDAIDCEVLDRGETMVRDRQSGEESAAGTWIVRGIDGIRYEFLGASELDRVLKPKLAAVRRGERWGAIIWRGADTFENGRTRTEYKVTTRMLGAGPRK